MWEATYLCCRVILFSYFSHCMSSLNISFCTTGWWHYWYMSTLCSLEYRCCWRHHMNGSGCWIGIFATYQVNSLSVETGCQTVNDSTADMEVEVIIQQVQMCNKPAMKPSTCFKNLQKNKQQTIMITIIIIECYFVEYNMAFQMHLWRLNSGNPLDFLWAKKK